MNEEDLKDVAEDAKEQEISEYESLQDFVDLEDLSSLMGEDDFADLEDLGDISDLDLDGDGILEDEAASEDEPEDSAKESVSAEEPEGASEDALQDVVSGGEPEDALQDIVSGGEPEDAGSGEEQGNPLPDVVMPETDADILPGAEETAAEDGQDQEYDDMVSLDDLPDLSEIEDLGLFSDDPAEEAATEEPAAEASVDDLVGDFLDDLDASGGTAGAEPEKEPGDTDAVDQDIPSAEEMDSLMDVDKALSGDMDAPEEAQDEPDIDPEAEPEEEAFGLDDILALEPEEEEPGDDMQALLEGLSEDDMSGLAADDQSASATGEKKPGLLKRLFGNIVTDEIAEAERAQREKDKEEAAAKQEAAEAAQAEKKLAKEAKAAEKAEAKKAKAEEKELKKAAKAEEKAQKKAEKEAKKAEEAAQAELEVTGKLNKVGVSIVIILAAMFLATEISGTEIFSYRSTMKQASGFFEAGKYTDAYQKILGTDMKKKDQETYDKIITVMKVQRSLNSYENYDNMKYYPDALNALLVGLKKYDENIETARNLEVEKDMDSCKEKILTLLDEEYGLSEEQAREILSLKKDTYTDRVVELGLQKKNS